MAIKKPDIDCELFNRQDLVSRVTELMKGQIVSGEVMAGNELPAEARLCEMFNVSRTVIREAMRNLRSQGLVDISQGRRARVKAMDSSAATDSLSLMLQRSDGTMKDFVEFRRPVEVAMVVLACERADEEGMDQMEQANEQLAQAATKEQIIDADIAFHQALARATGNCIFELMWETLAGIFRRHQVEMKAIGETQKTLSNHRALCEAIRDRDGERAKQVMREHLDMIEKDFLDAG